MTATISTLTIDDLQFSELDAFPTVEECQRVLYGLEPGASSPRCTPLRPHPAGSGVEWLQSLWCFTT